MWIIFLFYRNPSQSPGYRSCPRRRKHHISLSHRLKVCFNIKKVRGQGLMSKKCFSQVISSIVCFFPHLQFSRRIFTCSYLIFLRYVSFERGCLGCQWPFIQNKIFEKSPPWKSLISKFCFPTPCMLTWESLKYCFGPARFLGRQFYKFQFRLQRTLKKYYKKLVRRVLCA